MDGAIQETLSEFIWGQGHSKVVLTRAGDSWTVRYQTASRLLGPDMCQYLVTHRQAKLAAWDVMAKVTNACSDQTEGVEVAKRAARWMRDLTPGE